MINRRELKALARMRMSQSNPGYLKVMLLWVLAAVLVPQVAVSFATAPFGGSLDQLYELISSGIDPELALRALQISVGQLFASRALSVVLWVYQLIMSFGLALYCLRLYRGDPCGPAELFNGFSTPGRVLGGQLLVFLIVLACGIAMSIVLTVILLFLLAPITVLSTMSENVVFAAAVVLVLAYMAVIIAVMTNYALTVFVLADRPELEAMEAIRYGKNLIRGHRLQYIVLCLSFLGWSVLCSIPAAVFVGVDTILGLPLPSWAVSLIAVLLLLPNYLWLTPYAQTTIAGFYSSLRSEGFQPQLPPL